MPVCTVCVCVCVCVCVSCTIPSALPGCVEAEAVMDVPSTPASTLAHRVTDRSVPSTTL